MLLARAFARAELDPGRSVQQAMVNAMEAQSRSGPTALHPGRAFAVLLGRNDPSTDPAKHGHRRR
jgi:hypothetical protein